MKELKSRRLIITKGLLFLLLGLLAAILLLAQIPGWKTTALLVVCIWSFCRFYYFAFYVIEKYVDSEYRFSGIGSAVRYLLSRNS
jgi:hypothetical protein